MPQMAPMLWCLLFFYFILLLKVMMTSVFFSSLSETQAAESMSESCSMSWKW
ncbi:ATP synthase F0 subunit 8 (mitochondrion) [Hyalella azteca]|uniref:ATP synthase complex subunit 8 n=1 Tax=Hyalella azteca TaxID=294128 RepID=A0A385UKW6_HYAAZ|nr:ATP synthase F0 subunit 8 [Hyalella azteca]AYB71618.1 ATP synthase F0 subunit 8 [Hyalella azteca]